MHRDALQRLHRRQNAAAGGGIKLHLQIAATLDEELRRPGFRSGTLQSILPPRWRRRAALHAGGAIHQAIRTKEFGWDYLDVRTGWPAHLQLRHERRVLSQVIDISARR